MDVVEAVFRIDFRPLQQERLAVGSERLERRAAPAAVQRRVVQPYDDGFQRRRIVLVRQRVERSGAHVRMRIIEGGDELSGVVPGLYEPERAQRECAPPPQPAPRVAVGEPEHRQRPCDLPSPGDSRRIAILDERFDEQPREREPMSRGTCQQFVARRLVSFDRALHERAIPSREAPIQRPLKAKHRSLHDDGSGHRECGRDSRPDHEGRETREFGEEPLHRNPCTISTVSRSSLVSFERS